MMILGSMPAIEILRVSGDQMEMEKKTDGTKKITKAKRLEYIIFGADAQIKQNADTVKSIERELCCHPFKIHNIPLEEKKILVRCLLESFQKEKLIIPEELLALAMLNIVDDILIRKNIKYFNWTFHVKDISTWRKSCAAKILKRKGYIEIVSTNCWLRTEKEFEESDFYKGVDNGKD